jgi:hypothetical protein
MRTPDQYREFAAECYRLAAGTKTEAHQKMFEEMARARSEVAEEVETKFEKARRTSCRECSGSLPGKITGQRDRVNLGRFASRCPTGICPKVRDTRDRVRWDRIKRAEH